MPKRGTLKITFGEIRDTPRRARSDAELKTIAVGIYKGEIFPSWFLRKGDARLIPNIFMPLALMGPELMKDMQVRPVAHVFGEMKDAGPMGINGYPIFSACAFLTEDEAVKIDEKVQAIRDAVEGL